MIKKTIAACIIISILELLITSYFGAMLGGIGTLVWCITTAVIGFYIIKRNTSVFAGNLVTNLSSGLFDSSIWHKLIMSLGGVLLILPGFITDILAIVFILPITRYMIVLPIIQLCITKIMRKF